MSKKNQDKKLFFRVKKKDTNAFIEAYDLYADDLYRFVFFKIGHSEEAKDLTSAVFLKVWNYAQAAAWMKASLCGRLSIKPPGIPLLIIIGKSGKGDAAGWRRE